MMSSAEVARAAREVPKFVRRIVRKEHVRNVKGVEIGQEAAASTGAPRLWVRLLLES